MDCASEAIGDIDWLSNEELKALLLAQREELRSKDALLFGERSTSPFARRRVHLR